MASDQSSETPSTDDSDAGGGSGTPKTVAPDLLKDIKGKNTTRFGIEADDSFL